MTEIRVKYEKTFVFLFFFYVNFLHSDYLDYIYEDRNPSYNSFGVAGLIQTPSAEILGEANLHFVLNKNDIYKLGTLTIAPFDWMEASYFYYRPSDLLWAGPLSKGLYLDKGFNVKINYQPKFKYAPKVAIGMNDFAGHSLFSREYIVATQAIKNFKFNLGIGWGAFAQQKNYKNPLEFLGDRFSERGDLYNKDYGVGGNFSTDLWFTGPVGIFGGTEISIPYAKGMKFKIEYDPFDYMDFSCCGGGTSPESMYLRSKDSNINYGLSFPAFSENLTFDISYIKGNTINFTVAFGGNFSNSFFQKPKYKRVKPTITAKDKTKKTFYIDLLKNLNRKGLYLQSADLDSENDLDITISNSTYRSHIRSSSYAADTALSVADEFDIDVKKIQITHLNADMELSKISYLTKSFDNPKHIELIKKDTEILNNDVNGYKSHEFVPNVKFPSFHYGWTPAMVNHIGSPEKFLFAGAVIRVDTQLQFSRRLMLSTNFAFDLGNNFDEKVSDPGSQLQNVRTEIVRYLQEGDKYIPLMQLDYIWPISRDINAKISSGILERMYGGVGGEIIYKPLDRNFAIGAELYHVKQRDFDQLFDFKEYETETGHVNFKYQFNQGVILNLSYGKYLAQDVGYTFDLSRRTKSGFRAGFWFTRTDVSFEEFGEGSFDKGFYFQIPVDLFLRKHRGAYTNFRLRPLTRDGGQKLNQGKRLNGMLMNTQHINFRNQWSDFLD